MFLGHGLLLYSLQVHTHTHTHPEPLSPGGEGVSAVMAVHSRARPPCMLVHTLHTRAGTLHAQR